MVTDDQFERIKCIVESHQKMIRELVTRDEKNKSLPILQRTFAVKGQVIAISVGILLSLGLAIGWTARDTVYSSLEDCVLQNLRTSKTKLSAYLIRQSCEQKYGEELK